MDDVLANGKLCGRRGRREQVGGLQRGGHSGHPCQHIVRVGTTTAERGVRGPDVRSSGSSDVWIDVWAHVESETVREGGKGRDRERE